MKIKLEDLSGYTWGVIMSLEEYLQSVECGGFIDYDGWGYPIYEDGLVESEPTCPSKVDEIPEGTVKIIWFNR